VMRVMTLRITKTSSVKIVTIRMEVLFWKVIKHVKWICVGLCQAVPLLLFFKTKKKYEEDLCLPTPTD
jgi:hypothetical protein